MSIFAAARLAQSANKLPDEAAEDGGEITVTGSRMGRDGCNAPIG